jgi:hypothetical protein
LNPILRRSIVTEAASPTATCPIADDGAEDTAMRRRHAALALAVTAAQHLDDVSNEDDIIAIANRFDEYLSGDVLFDDVGVPHQAAAPLAVAA